MDAFLKAGMLNSIRVIRIPFMQVPTIALPQVDRPATRRAPDNATMPSAKPATMRRMETDVQDNINGDDDKRSQQAGCRCLGSERSPSPWQRWGDV
jgi:hypothetical protein